MATIAGPVLTSATYTAWTFLHDLLARIKFPIGDHGEPAIWIGEADIVPANIPTPVDRVVIRSTILTPNQEWGPVGAGARNERFAIPIVIETAIPGSDEPAARARLEQLTSAVELALHSLWQRTRNGDPDPALAPYPIAMIQAGTVRPQTLPTEGGWIGHADLVIDFEFRVGVRPVER